MTRRRPPRLLAITALFSATLVGCTLLPGPQPPIDTGLTLLNGTTKPVVLIVNGLRLPEVSAGTTLKVPASGLPALPWNAAVHMPDGRLVLSLVVRAGDVEMTTSASRGVGSRADLSCGRIDLFAGPPLVGPPPDAGVPGDCGP